MYEDIFAASAESCKRWKKYKTGKKESWNSGDQWLYGVPESSSYVWAFRAFPCHLVIAADEKSAKELYEDYRFYDKRVYYYPAKDLLFFFRQIYMGIC